MILTQNDDNKNNKKVHKWRNKKRNKRYSSTVNKRRTFSIHHADSSYTTDDLVPINKYKRGSRVICRPSAKSDDKWLHGTIHDITEIDNKQYLSIMTEFGDDGDVTFAQYYIPIGDSTRVRPLSARNDKEKENEKENDSKIVHLELGQTNSNPQYVSSPFTDLGIGGVGIFSEYDMS
eukprot:194009_1